MLHYINNMSLFNVDGVIPDTQATSTTDENQYKGVVENDNPHEPRTTDHNENEIPEENCTDNDPDTLTGYWQKLGKSEKF